MTRALAIPTLDDIGLAIATRKHISDSVQEILAYATITPGVTRGDKIGKLKWAVSFYRADGRLKAKFIVNGMPVAGIDYHLNASSDHRGGEVPCGYHWDIYWPLWQASSKCKFETHLGTLGEYTPDQIDRITLAVVCRCWHIHFELDRQTTLQHRKRSKR